MNERLLKAVGSLYDASLDATLWLDALGDLTDLFGGKGFTLFLVDKRTKQVPLSYFQGLGPRSEAEYVAHYSSLEPGLPFITANPGLPFFTDLMWISEAAMDRTEFHDWLQTRAGVRYRLGGMVADSKDYYGITALQLTREQGPPSEATQRLFLQLLPHIRRAARINQEFAALKDERAVDREILDQLLIGVLLLDRRGKAVFVNRLAERMLGRCDGLSLDSERRLRCARADDSRLLDRIIAATALTGGGKGLYPGRTLAIARASGARPFEILVAPLADRRAVLRLDTTPAVVIFIVDPERRSEIPAAILERLFALTPAEAKLLAALAQDETLKTVADVLAITEGTARQVLKSVFRKTETHSQAGLMKLVFASLAAQIRGDR